MEAQAEIKALFAYFLGFQGKAVHIDYYGHEGENYSAAYAVGNIRKKEHLFHIVLALLRVARADRLTYYRKAGSAHAAAYYRGNVVNLVGDCVAVSLQIYGNQIAVGVVSVVASRVQHGIDVATGVYERVGHKLAQLEKTALHAAGHGYF